jgi:uncharacterized protein YodC (DUF2158 family)
MAQVIPLAAERTKRRAKFKRGSVVSLRSGGYVMTVRKPKETPEGRLYVCDYYDDMGEKAVGEYFEEQLKTFRETKVCGPSPSP